MTGVPSKASIFPVTSVIFFDKAPSIYTLSVPSFVSLTITICFQVFTQDPSSICKVLDKSPPLQSWTSKIVLGVSAGL